MEVWQTVLFAIGGNAVLLAVLGVLGKSLLEKIIARDTKQYEADLKVKTDSAIENLRSQLLHQVESYKIQLKKSEYLFQREFEAVSFFIALRQEIEPRYNNPDMDWSEACEQIATGFGKTEKVLGAFLAKHGAALVKAERELLSSALTIAGTGSFEVVDGIMSDAAYTKAEEFNTTMNDLESLLRDRIRRQSAL